jgi:hypothetical protein
LKQKDIDPGLTELAQVEGEFPRKIDTWQHDHILLYINSR